MSESAAVFHRYPNQRDMYLDLLRDSLVGLLLQDPPIDLWAGELHDADGKVIPITEINTAKQPVTVHPGKFDARKRNYGLDWPMLAQSMIGKERMSFLRSAVEAVVDEDIEGDLVETGVWRGGACIFMQGILVASMATHRRIFVCDSFAGLPKPSTEQDATDLHHGFGPLIVSVDEVVQNFVRYGLLRDNVVFVPGWFKDTLSTLPTEKIALLRLDGDMYASTMDALTACFDRVSQGGFIIVDDYFSLKTCRGAVDDFRASRGIADPITSIDGVGAYWRKA